MKTVFEDKEVIKNWVEERIPGMSFNDGSYAAIGVENEQGERVAGVIYNHYTGHDISMHVASTHGTLWARPHILRDLFAFPFNQLKCRRVTGFVSALNEHTLPFDEHLGFRREGILRDATPDGDMHIIGMTRQECRWLEKDNG